MWHTKAKLLLASLLTGPVLTGCASMGLGESDYACKGYPTGVGCVSTTEAYEMTNADLPEIREMLDKAEKERQTSNTEEIGDGNPYFTATDNNSAAESSGKEGNASVDVARTIRRSEQPMPVPYLDDGAVPIRTPSQTMRIWIAPWEDERGNLQITGRIYTEIEPRRWVVGLPAKTVSKRLRLLQAAERAGGDPRKSGKKGDYGKGVKEPKGE